MTKYWKVIGIKGVYHFIIKLKLSLWGEVFKKPPRFSCVMWKKVLINLGFGTFFKDYHKMVDYYPQKKSNSDV